MSLISYNQLCNLVESGFIKGVDPDAINATSIDVHLGRTLLVEDPLVSQGPDNIIDLSKKEKLHFEKIVLGETGQYCMEPGAFLLAETTEIFNLPNNISTMFILKSSLARSGLEHLHAGWCDAGWNGSVLTMELKNLTRRHRLLLRAGMRIGQMLFFEHTAVPSHASYATKGSYNGMKEVSAAK